MFESVMHYFLDPNLTIDYELLYQDKLNKKK